MTEISRTFAKYALTKSSFPDETIQSAKTFILDSLGVGIAGANAPYNEAVFKTIRMWGQGDSTYLWGHRNKAPTASAAYLNGFQIHSMEYDCVHEAAVVHPMATILAALSAEADSQGNISGQQFLEAIIVAVDVAIELGVAASSPLKFFRPATAGLFGATVGISRLRGYNEATTLSAMGCALAQCAGVMQAHVEGKPTLPVQIAGAARAAVIACDLAENGVHGPEQSLEGPYGYFVMFEDKADVISAVEKLGHIHRITEVSWKPFPTGRAAQGGIVAVQQLRNQGVTIDNLDWLVLSAPPIIGRLVGRPVIDKMTANYARLCFAYLAPVTLIRGMINLQDFSPKDLSDPQIRKLANKVRIEINHVTDPAEFVPQTATAHLKDGQIKTATVTELFGSPIFPLTLEQHLKKFRDCVSFGLRKVNAKIISSRLIALIDKLEELPECREIFSLAAGFTD